MKRAPPRAEIAAAETQVAQAKLDVQDRLRRVRTAFRATLARPSTLAVAAGAAGLLGFWLAWRPRRPTSPSPTTANSTANTTATVAKTSALSGVVLAFVVRYVRRRLPFVVRHLWAAGRKRAARTNPPPISNPNGLYPNRPAPLTADGLAGEGRLEPHKL